MPDFHEYVDLVIRGDITEAESLYSLSREPFCFPEAKKQWTPPRPYNIVDLVMNWKVDLKKKHITAINELTIESKIDSLEKVHLNAAEMNIILIQDEQNNKLDYYHNPDDFTFIIHLTEPLKATTQQKLVISYEVTAPLAGGFFITPSKTFPDFDYQFWTQFQDNYAQYLLPIYDHPSHKFPCEMIVTVPEDFTAVSNGKLLSEKKNKDKTITFHWRQKKPIPAYLITLAIGKFVLYEEKLDDLPVQYYAEERFDKETVYRSFGKTPQMIAFFNEKFGVKFPWKKYAQVAAADFVMGGMENVSATTQTDATFHDEIADNDYSSEGLVSHELVHQWIGDLITCKSWSHGWINEGGATQLQNEWKKHDLGLDEYLYEQLGKKTSYLKEDKESYRRPLVQNKWEWGFDVFDRHLYPGAAWRYYMLKHLVGEETWWKVLGHLLTKHAFESIETIDAQRAFEDITGNDFGWFFDQWLYKAGYPEVEINIEYNPDEKAITLSVEQKQKDEETVKAFRFPLAVDIVDSNNEISRQNLEIRERAHTFYFTVKEKPKMVLIDPDFAVLLDETINKPTDLWINQLQDGPNIIMRIKAAKALGKKPTIKNISALNEALLEEPFWGVQAEIAKALGATKDLFALEGLVKATKLNNSKARTAVAQALGNFYQNDDALSALKKMLDDKESYLAEAAAATSIGKIRHSKSYDILEKRLPKARDSWNNTVIRGYLSGIAATKKIEAIDIILPYLEIGRPNYVRREAIGLLADLGQQHKKRRAEVKEILEKTLLTDESYRVQSATITAIKKYGDPSLISALEQFKQTHALNNLKRNCKVATRALNKKKDSDELKALQKSVEELQKENKELKARVDTLEMKVKKE
jgi:aminopeptidase N